MPIARVAELVDALDLGSSSAKEWEFESPLSHHTDATEMIRKEIIFREELSYAGDSGKHQRGEKEDQC